MNPMADVTRPHASPDGYQFWHGAQGWEGSVDIRPSRPKSYEYGPGLYLTTQLRTAKQYGRGAGCLIEMELAPTTRWLEDAHLEMADMEAFLKERSGLRRRPAILADLHRCLDRMRERQPDLTTLPAPILVNLCVNHDALSGSHGPALARFLVDHGIDASYQNKSIEETWVVLFNPEVVTRKVRHRVATVDPHADFPLLKVQQARIAAQALDVAPALAPVPPAPARRRSGPGVR
jgi:hypothetical protein